MPVACLAAKEASWSSFASPSGSIEKTNRLAPDDMGCAKGGRQMPTHPRPALRPAPLSVLRRGFTIASLMMIPCFFQKTSSFDLLKPLRCSRCVVTVVACFVARRRASPVNARDYARCGNPMGERG